MPTEAFFHFLADHHGVFTRSEAEQLGVNSGQLATLIKNRTVVRTYPATYRISSSPRTWLSRIRGASASAKAVVSHRSAAHLWKLDGFPQALLEVTIPEDRSLPMPGVKVHRSRQFGLVDSVEISGLDVTGIGRTILDLAAVVSPSKLNQAIDSAIRQRLVEWPDLYLVLALHSRRGRTGCGRLRKVLDVRFGEEVIPESMWSRHVADLLVDAGLPVPRFEHEVFGAQGKVLARVDLAYPSQKLAIELDSVRWHFNQRSFVADPRRKNALTISGWTVLTFTWSDYVDNPAELVKTVRRALSSMPRVA